MLNSKNAPLSGSSADAIIGVVIPSLSNSVFNEVLKGIYDLAGTRGYKVLTANTHYAPREEERVIRTLLNQSPEAMIITGGEQTPDCERLLLNANIPVVQTMELLEQPLDMNLGLCHYQAGRAVAQALLEAGYGLLGFMGARMDSRARQRQAGFRSVLEECGRYWSRFFLTRLDPSSCELGGHMFRELYESNHGVPDAIFCCNDDLALGALFESQRMGVAVPEDMGLIGFNDLDISALTNPSLSSVAVPRYEMGLKAAEMVIARLQGQAPEPKHNLGFELRLRQSTGML